MAAKDYLAGSKLYSNRVCPFAHRAELSNAARDLPLEVVNIPTEGEVEYARDFGKVGPNSVPVFGGWTVQQLKDAKQTYKEKINPSGAVPALELGTGDIIVESHVCADFIDRVAPEGKGTKLHSDDPVIEAKMQTALKRFDACGNCLYAMLWNQDPAQDAERAAALIKNLDNFAEALDTKSDYCFGNSFSLVDVHCAPLLYRHVPTIAHWRGFDAYSGKHGDRLRRMMAKVTADPIFIKGTRITLEEIVICYEDHANGFKVKENATPDDIWAGRGRTKMGE